VSEHAKLARLDQEHAELRDVAQLSGHYYTMLRDSGVPTILSFLLVRDWHRCLWLEDEE